MSIRDDAEKLWQGEPAPPGSHPFMPTGELEEIAAGVAFCRWFANVIVLKTEEGLVLIDTGGYFNQEATFGLVRGYSTARLHTAIYTHGHVDHACGLPPFVAEAQKNHVARPRVVGHRAVAARFDRYKLTAGYNNVINERQFSARSNWPTEYIYPDTYFEHQLTVVAGNHKLQCHHARGETDDHCWIYIPQSKVLCTGDFFIWAVPNAGNPQKVQRYAHEWAEALRAMAKVGAEVLAPGHGCPIYGALRVKQALNETAEYLEALHTQTVALMNSGASLDDVLHSVKPPVSLAERPYLQAVYDEPDFIVRNVWRLNGGWYDGIPSHLKPAPEADQAREIVALAGGIEKLTSRAEELAAGDNFQMACHLIDWAVNAEPENKRAHEARARIYAARADRSRSTMSFGIFRSTARESAAKAGLPLPDTQRRF
jgi:alkyl sulfatase BDS1-like metallo-beta-lactamase superfamily hydrolase